MNGVGSNMQGFLFFIFDSDLVRNFGIPPPRVEKKKISSSNTGTASIAHDTEHIISKKLSYVEAQFTLSKFSLFENILYIVVILSAHIH